MRCPQAHDNRPKQAQMASPFAPVVPVLFTANGVTEVCPCEPIQLKVEKLQNRSCFEGAQQMLRGRLTGDFFALHRQSLPL